MECSDWSGTTKSFAISGADAGEATGMLEKPTPSIFTVVFYGLKFFAAKLRNSA
jgi:hypothetical protein